MTAKNTILEEARIEAKKLSEKLLGQASIAIEEEKSAALATLKNEVATLSVQMAEKLLEKELEAKPAQEKLVERLLKEVHWN